MQIQTPTITTEQMNAPGANLQIKKLNAFCDCCDNQASGTKEDLARRGWGLSSDCQFCPECN